MMKLTDRRRLLRQGATIVAAGLLSGCDRLSQNHRVRSVLHLGEDANLFVQRLLLQPAALAPEFPESAISAFFKPNGSTDPDTKAYKALAATNFANFRLEIGGLVDRPSKYSLAELRALPSRDQITRHDCVEGWSCIGRWRGVPMSTLLDKAGLKPEARYIVLHCADVMEEAADENAKPVFYYESIDLVDAYHPQTILAYDMNGKPLPIEHGAPLRMRLERQLGYKMAKYVTGIEVAADLNGFGDGNGGYWEDRGYDWYAGI